MWTHKRLVYVQCIAAIGVVVLIHTVYARASVTNLCMELSWDVQQTDLETAEKLESEARRLYQAGKYDEAISTAQRSLELYQKARGPNHPDVGRALSNLALLHYSRGEYDAAQPLYEHAMSIFENTPLVDNLALILNNLGEVHHIKGDYQESERLFKRSLSIRENKYGPDHPSVAQCLNNLAFLYEDWTADYVVAESLLQRSLDIRRKAKGVDGRSLAIAVHNLGSLYGMKGDYIKAAEYFNEALSLLQQALPPGHPDMTRPLNGLAQMYFFTGEFKKAEPLFQQTLDIREKSLGPNHPDVAEALMNSAIFYFATGNHEKGEPLIQRATQIYKDRFGVDHPLVGTCLSNLGYSYLSRGNYDKAEPLLQQSLEIRKNKLGPLHPDLAESLANLALLSMMRGNISQAVDFSEKARIITERNIDLNVGTGSERQKLLYLASLSDQTNLAISLNADRSPTGVAATRHAMLTVLQRKGRATDAVVDSMAALRALFKPQDQKLLEDLIKGRARLAKAVLNGPGTETVDQYKSHISDLEQQREKLEKQAGDASAEYRLQAQPISIESIQANLPDGTALVEFVAYKPVASKFSNSTEKYGETRYVAYVLRSRGNPVLIKLNEASFIDDAVRALLQPLEDPESSLDTVKQISRTLYDNIMKDVRKNLVGVRKLLISPDGMLNLVPFGALVDERGQYLIKAYSMSYLTSGRDIVRFNKNAQPVQKPVFIGNPNYGAPPRACTARESSFRATNTGQPDQIYKNIVDFSHIYFCPLPGTEQEVRSLKAKWPDAELVVDSQATEAFVKGLSRPSILHIATHGFFFEDIKVPQPAKAEIGLSAIAGQSGQGSPSFVHVENPLLRSGLAMAGANSRKSGNDDGILTALEVAGLDLRGTALVILSACQTGVGEVHTAEGVFGLRRALLLAGSETQVLSLWRVNDEATRLQMLEYYKRLRSGEERGEALRQVQLWMMHSKKSEHPYYWASFILTGESTAMKRTKPVNIPPKK